jgi:NitT/TauT family transport system substrate-binding protein
MDTKHELSRRRFLRRSLGIATAIGAANAFFAPQAWAYTFTTSGRKYPAQLKMASQVAASTPGYIWEHTDLVKRRLGIAAEWRTYLAGAQQMQAFAIGQWEIGYVGVPPLITGVSQGMKARAIAVGQSQGSNVVARKDRGFKTLQELGGDHVKAWQQFKGRTIGLPPKASIQDAITRTALSEARMTDKDVDLRNYDAVPSLPDLLAQGQIDAFVGWPPFDVVATSKGSGSIVIPGDQFGLGEWRDYPMNCLVASEKLIQEYPDVVQDCVYVHTQVNQFLMAYPEEAAKMIAAVLKMDEKSALEGYQLTPNYCPDLTEGTIRSCMRFVKTLADAKYLQRAPSESELFDTRFIRNVWPAGQCTDRVAKVPRSRQLHEFVTGKA